MNAAKVTLTATVLAAALGLALGLSTPPAQADPKDDDGCHSHQPCQGFGRSDNAPATSGFDNDVGDAILSDCTTGAEGDDEFGNQCYVDGEDRVSSTLGGQRPARYELRAHKSTHRRVGRQITLDLSGCDILDGFGCGRLKDILGLDDVAALNNVTINGFVLALRPYATECPPGPEPCGGVNVFTMDPVEDPAFVAPVPMGLWIYFGESQLQLEFASEIDSRSSIDPGRGLEVCEAEGMEVGNLDDVMVTASTASANELPSDQNNSWTVEVAGGSALVYLTDKDQECVAKITDVFFSLRIERAE